MPSKEFIFPLSDVGRAQPTSAEDAFFVPSPSTQNTPRGHEDARKAAPPSNPLPAAAPEKCLRRTLDNGQEDSEGKIVGGMAHVKGGTLIFNRRLGDGLPGNEGEPSERNHIGAIKVNRDAVLSFTHSSEDYNYTKSDPLYYKQILGGHIGQDYAKDPINGYIYMPEKPDGIIQFNAGYYEIAVTHNSFQGDLIIGDDSGDPTHLKISGGIGTVMKTFDGNTASAASYYHNLYTGNIDIKGVNDVLEFSYKGDYQFDIELIPKRNMNESIVSLFLDRDTGEQVYWFSSDKRIGRTIMPKRDQAISIHLELQNIFPVGIFSLRISMKTPARSIEYVYVGDVMQFEIDQNPKDIWNIHWRPHEKFSVIDGNGDA